MFWFVFPKHKDFLATNQFIYSFVFFSPKDVKTVERILKGRGGRTQFNGWEYEQGRGFSLQRWTVKGVTTYIKKRKGAESYILRFFWVQEVINEGWLRGESEERRGGESKTLDWQVSILSSTPKLKEENLEETSENQLTDENTRRCFKEARKETAKFKEMERPECSFKHYETSSQAAPHVCPKLLPNRQLVILS